MLPRLIEYILSLEEPGGRPLAQHASAQIVIPFFPPGTILSFDLYPFTSDYANIEFDWRISREVVDGAFDFEVSHSGVKIFKMTMDEVAKRENLTFIPFTWSKPGFTRLENITTINQYWANTDSFLIVLSRDDWDLIRAALDKLTRPRHSLSNQAERLLEQMEAR